MTSTETTTKTNHYYYLRALAALATLALMASLLVALAAKPAHAETTFTVNSTGDQGEPAASVGDGKCDVDSSTAGDQCTLRAALEEANFTSGAISTINFDIPGSGVKTIKPSSPLFIVEQVTIDGYSQPGAKENTLAKGNDAVLKIELDGSNAGVTVPGLEIFNAQNCVIRGLVINRFKSTGVFINGASAKDNRVEGNFIGTDPSGTLDLGNGDAGVGIGEASDNNVVGGTSPDKRNLISGNRFEGVGFRSANNRVEGNLIGTQKDGIKPLGNDASGVDINGSSNNTVGGATPTSANTIAFNGFDGVVVRGGATGNRILSNSIFSNVEQGIDLTDDGVTPNDDKDPDTGANNLQNFPVLTSAKTGRKATTIQGKLNSTPNTTFTLQFFGSPETDPSGFGEGKTFRFQKSVTTDSSGNATFIFKTKKKVPKGQLVTATATDPDGDTSEFSSSKQVV